ncbi:hypothetical protein [Hansschlegelia zhihuaiae]|nr:hypothetical protein [Hansschlegelia zhihuaiae]
MRLDAHDRIDARVEIRGAPEDVDADGIGLAALVFPGERLADHESKKK